MQTIIRYGVQIITHIEKKGTYNLKILEKKLSQKTLSLDVENSGSWMQNPSLLLELVDLQGKKIGKFEAQKQRIFPDCSVKYQIDLSSINPGKYKAMVLLDHGETSLFGAKYDIEID